MLAWSANPSKSQWLKNLLLGAWHKHVPISGLAWGSPALNTHSWTYRKTENLLAFLYDHSWTSKVYKVFIKAWFCKSNRVCVCVYTCLSMHMWHVYIWCGRCICTRGIYSHMVSVGMCVHVWCVYTVDMYMCGGGGPEIWCKMKLSGDLGIWWWGLLGHSSDWVSWSAHHSSSF